MIIYSLIISTSLVFEISKDRHDDFAMEIFKFTKEKEKEKSIWLGVAQLINFEGRLSKLELISTQRLKVELRCLRRKKCV